MFLLYSEHIPEGALPGVVEPGKGRPVPLAQVITIRWNMPHSTRFSGKGCHHSSKAPGGEDLEIEEPVSCGDCSSFHFDATLAGMLGSTLIRHQVIQVREPS